MKFHIEPFSFSGNKEAIFSIYWYKEKPLESQVKA